MAIEDSNVCNGGAGAGIKKLHSLTIIAMGPNSVPLDTRKKTRGGCLMKHDGNTIVVFEPDGMPKFVKRNDSKESEAGRAQTASWVGCIPVPRLRTCKKSRRQN